MKKNNILILCIVIVSVVVLCYIFKSRTRDTFEKVGLCPSGNAAMMGVCKKTFYAYVDAEYRHYKFVSQALNLAVDGSGNHPDGYTNALYHLSLQFSILAELISQDEAPNNISKVVNEILTEIENFSNMNPSPVVQKVIDANHPLSVIISELHSDLRAPQYRLKHLWIR
jgi:hypothetical protein